MVLRVVLDTNFPLLPFKPGIKVYSQIRKLVEGDYELVMPDYCLRELKKLGGENVDPAISLMEKKGVQILGTGKKGGADKHLKKLDPENNVVCTSDKELKKELLKKGFRIIYPRGNKKLSIR